MFALIFLQIFPGRKKIYCRELEGGGGGTIDNCGKVGKRRIKKNVCKNHK